MVLGRTFDGAPSTMQPLEIAQMIIPEEDSNAIIDNTDDYTDDTDDEPEEATESVYLPAVMR